MAKKAHDKATLRKMLGSGAAGRAADGLQKRKSRLDEAIDGPKPKPKVKKKAK